MLFSIFFLLFILVQTSQSFKEDCLDEIIDLKCQKNDLIITEIHQNGICISCKENHKEHHVKEKEKELKRLCGKSKLCEFNDHDEKIFKGYKCHFQQNKISICVPSELKTNFFF
jgi:hypothetical protein